MPAVGDLLTLDVERPAVGGRMIARHGGVIVLVGGTIPGERVRARVDRVQRRTIFATTVEVLEASPDRVAADAGLSCGGHVFAHIAEVRQAALKGEMIGDAFRRLARLDIGNVPVASGPADGYRTRARVHVRRGHWGFFEEGSHVLCDVAGSRQLSAASADALGRLCAGVAAGADNVAEVEWAETTTGSHTAAHVAYLAAAGRRALTPCAGIDGASWSDEAGVTTLAWGEPFVVDELAPVGDAAVAVRHHVRAFFQGNRHLLQPLVDDVVARVETVEVADLYAGVGLFSVVLSASGRVVDAVEGDAVAAADLQVNAGAAGRIRVHHRPVETFVRRSGLSGIGTVVVDPPRVGLAPEVSAALGAAAVSRVVYVSCDPATLARDVRLLVDGGFDLAEVRAFDLFPRTAHVETVVTLRRRRG